MKNLAKNRSTLGLGCKALLLLVASFGSQAQQLDAIDQAARQNNSAQLPAAQPAAHRPLWRCLQPLPLGGGSQSAKWVEVIKKTTG